MLVINGESRRLLEIIQAQGDIAAGDLDQHRAMQVIVDRVPDLIGADGAVIDSPDGDRLIFRAGSGVDPQVIGWDYARSDSLSGLALERRDVVISDDTHDDVRVEHATCRKLGARSLLCAPLVHLDEELGSLTAFSTRPNAFDQEDREAIGLLGRSLSAHLHHAAGFSRASYLSMHDHLTGLQNRRAYELRLHAESARDRRGDDALSLCLLDLDRFKAVNDRFGHVAGDEVLRSVARGFDRHGLHADAFRIGGDEFAVVFPGRDVAAVRAAIRGMVDEFDIGGLKARGISFGISFGIAADKADPNDLHAAADAELTSAKRLCRLPKPKVVKAKARTEEGASPEEAQRSAPSAERTARSMSG